MSPWDRLLSLTAHEIGAGNPMLVSVHRGSPEARPTGHFAQMNGSTQECNGLDRILNWVPG